MYYTNKAYNWLLTYIYFIWCWRCFTRGLIWHL